MTGARAAGTVDTPVAVPAAAALLLTRLMAGDRSEEVLARVGALRTEELIAALEGCSRWQREEQAAADVLALELLRRPGIAWQRPGELPYRVALALGATLARHGDGRCVSLLEYLLAHRDPQLRHVAELETLATYYRCTRQGAKAARTLLRTADYTDSPAVRGTTTVDAAREYAAAGDLAAAERTYRSVAAIGYGWATGCAMADQASRLIRQRRFAEARTLLADPVTGQYAEQIEVVLEYLRGLACEGEGDLAQARAHYAGTVAKAVALGRVLPGEGLEGYVSDAKARLERLPAGS